MALELTGEESAVLIAGPTASGKSGLALALAEDLARRGVAATIVNADSMQVYDALRVLTARPDAADLARAPHRLYGHVGAGERHSVGAWLAEAAAEIGRIRSDGGVPIVVGGTGLYFRALTQGLAEIPPVPAEVRAAWWDRAEGLSAAELHGELAARDAEGAAALRPGDRQRILRAIEVFEATGTPLSQWQARPPGPPVVAPEKARLVVVEPDRAALRERIGQRLEAMMAAGALDEVAALAALRLDPALPVMKAIGVRPLADHLAGTATREEAVARAATETRQYARRQSTWFRNQMDGWERIPAP